MRALTTNTLRSALLKLGAAGFGETQVARWFGVPLVTDARYVPSSVRPAPRRGLSAWIALLVGGEELPEADLGILDEAERGALVEGGLVERRDGRLYASYALLPVRGLFVASDRVDAVREDAGDGAVVMVDLSAMTVAACLPPSLQGVRSVDVGCGAGFLTLLCARLGAEAIGTDVDARGLAMAELNARLNDLPARFHARDLWNGTDGKFGLVTFNAPLLRAPFATSDPEAANSYYTNPRGPSLLLEFLRELPARLEEGGEAIVQAQLVPEVERALDELAAELAVLSVRYADAPDGTPHAILRITRGCAGWRAGSGRRRAHVPLGPICPVIDRRILDALAQPRELDENSTPLPAPWLELRESRQLVAAGGAAWRQLRFGPARIDDTDLELLLRLRGQSLAELALDEDARARLQRLIHAGAVIVS